MVFFYIFIYEEEQLIKDFHVKAHTNEMSEFELDHIFITNLKFWAVNHKITHGALKQLLNIFEVRLPSLKLPKDPRTFLTTPRDICIIKNIGHNSGEYWHHGAERTLKRTLKHINKLPSQISLNINIDGLPLYKSSKQEFWPILCYIYELPNIKPLIIGIFYGSGKLKSIIIVKG